MLKKTIIYTLILVLVAIYATPAFAHSNCHNNKRVGSPGHNPRVNRPWEYKADKNHNGFVDPIEARKWGKGHGHKHHPGCGHNTY